MKSLQFAIAALASITPISGVFAQSAPAAISAQSPRYGPWIASKVAPGVHLLAAPSDYFGPAVGNVTLIEQSDGWVVIDSGLTAGNGREVVRFARSLSPKPIKAVAITHWHNDHPQGISAIRDAFPNVRIIATEATERGMLGAEGFDVDYKPNPMADDAMAKQVADTIANLTKLRDDPATAPDRRERIIKALGEFARFAEDFRGTYIVTPTETFTRSLDLDDPLRPVELWFLGRANTEGDLVAWLPRERIVVSGDIVVAPTPFGFGSFAGDWIETLGKLKALQYAVLIPGHGAPQRDGAYLDKLSATIANLRAKIGPLAKAGVPVEDIKQKVDWAQVMAPWSDTPRNKANFESLFLDPMIPNVYKEALGRPIVQGEGGPAPSFKPVPPRSTAKRHKT